MKKFDVIVLAGGFGTRLQSVVSDIPKPMAPVAGRPFIEYVLDQLPVQHIGTVVLAVGYKHEVIQSHFKSTYNNLNIEYCVENEPLGTGGAIKLALTKTSLDTIVILNGDSFFDVDFEQLYERHTTTKADLTLALKQINNPDRYGTVLFENNRVIQFTEKQTGLATGLINGGVYMLSRSIVDELPTKDQFSFESDFLSLKTNSLTISGYIDKGTFIDIGIPSDYERSQELFAK